MFTGATDKAPKDIPAPKLAKFAGPTLRFMFCYSWGYKRVFEQFANAIQQKYPDLKIEGDHYPPPPTNQIIVNIISATKIALIILVVSGQNPFPWFGMETPSAYTWALTNKIYAAMMLFFLSNAIEGQLISTGAFEVTFNDVPIWSKLETGRIPAPQEMFQIIENHMRFNP